MTGDFDNLLTIYGSILYIFFYPIFIMYLVLILQVGIFSWVIIGLCLTPPTMIWYMIMKRRLENYLKTLKAKPRKWNLDETVNEYLHLVDKRKKDS